MSNQIVEKMLSINDAKTMVLGGTLIDLDSSVGYQGGQMAQARNPNQVLSCPNDALALYPAVEATELEHRESDDPNMLAMASCWVNGFSPYTRGIPDPDNCTRPTATIMNKYGVVTTDQILKARPPEQLSCLFTAFKWYGSKDSDDRLLPEEYQDDNQIGKNVRRGIVHPNWFIKPLSIRYLMRSRGDKESQDYCYFIGGSDELLREDMMETCKEIYTTWKRGKELLEEAGNGSIPQEIRQNSELNDAKKVWNQLDLSEFSDDFAEHAYTRGRMMMRKLNRMMQGVILIRNSLKYLNMYVSIDDIIDFGSGEPVQMAITDIQKRYDDAYHYVRNFCSAYPEVATAAFDY